MRTGFGNQRSVHFLLHISERPAPVQERRNRRIPIGTDWYPSDDDNPQFGILPFIAGSIYVTLGALILAVPIGVLTAIFMAEIADKRVVEIMRSVVQLLAGIPSVIYGFFGVIVISKFIRETFGGTGYSMLSGAIILAIMVLPTIINITEVTIASLPKSIKEGSLALGGTRWQDNNPGPAARRKIGNNRGDSPRDGPGARRNHGGADGLRETRRSCRRAPFQRFEHLQ